VPDLFFGAQTPGRVWEVFSNPTGSVRGAKARAINEKRLPMQGRHFFVLKGMVVEVDCFVISKSNRNE
jgi:hypothetical protein